MMAWAASETPADATFAVIGYPADRGFVEWFPALSGRENVTTWQGTEWVPGGFRREEATTISNCRDPDCLPEADYYVLRPGCCPDLDSSLREVRPGVFVGIVIHVAERESEVRPTRPNGSATRRHDAGMNGDRSKVPTDIPITRPLLGQEEIDAVAEVLKLRLDRSGASRGRI